MNKGEERQSPRHEQPDHVPEPDAVPRRRWRPRAAVGGVEVLTRDGHPAAPVLLVGTHASTLRGWVASRHEPGRLHRPRGRLGVARPRIPQAPAAVGPGRHSALGHRVRFPGRGARLGHVVWDTLPSALGYAEVPAWWPILTIGLAGLLVALTVKYLPGHGGHLPADGFGGGVTPPSAVPGVALAAGASLVGGAVLGPEAPLVAIGGGLALLAIRRTSPPATAPRPRSSQQQGRRPRSQPSSATPWSRR